MNGNRKYVVAVVLLGALAVAFGVFGTVAPPLAEKSTPIQTQQESSSESVGHFQNPPSYDSGWVDITAKTGQYVTLEHDLNTTEVVVDITGKQSLDPMGGGFAWNRTYGSPTADWATSVVQASDGGYALAGTRANKDCWLVRTDSAGNMLWNKTYGGAEQQYVYAMLKTSDEGYILAGFTSSFGAGLSDGYLVKTDLAGNMVWNKTYGGTSGDYCYSVVQTSDGGYAIAGYTESYDEGNPDFWLVKTDSSGTMQWNKTYGGGGIEYARSVIQTSDGGYAIAGYTNSFGAGQVDGWLVKTDSAGNMVWNKTYGGTDQDPLFSVVLTSDGGYALAGWTNSYGAGMVGAWLIKTDLAGNMVWNKTYGGTSTDDFAYALVQTDDLGYALAGCTCSYSGGSEDDDLWLIRTDSFGNMQWNQTYGTPASEEVVVSIAQTSDGGYAMAGGLLPGPSGIDDFWLVKANGEMQMDHQMNYGDFETGLTWTRLTNTTITLHRGETDPYWNYVRVRIWLIKEPSWIYGDINMDGVVDAKDLYIIGRNYGKTFSLLSITGIVAVAGIHTVKKRKQSKQPSNIS